MCVGPQTFVECGQESMTRDKTRTMIAVVKPKVGYIEKNELRIALFKDQTMRIEAIEPPPYEGPLVDKFTVEGKRGVTLRM